jgi:hypothetical protein
MKVLKILLIVIGAIILLLVIVFGVYLLINRQGVIESHEINSPDLEQKVLIASQGSDFKNALVESLVTHLKERPIYIKITDVTTLSEIKEADWDALVLIHTTEQQRLQPDVEKYLDRAENLTKVVLVTTSGPGNWKTDDYDVDVITSASKMNELPLLASSLLKRIDTILQQ